MKDILYNDPMLQLRYSVDVTTCCVLQRSEEEARLRRQPWLGRLVSTL